MTAVWWAVAGVVVVLILVTALLVRDFFKNPRSWND